MQVHCPHCRQSLYSPTDEPLPGGALYLPWQLYADPKSKSLVPVMFQWAIGYGLITIMLLAWSAWLTRIGIHPIVITDEGTHLG